MNRSKNHLLILCLLLSIGTAVNAQTKLDIGNSGDVFGSCSGSYTDDGGRSLYSDSYDPDEDGNPDFLCWTFCPSHPINEGVRIIFNEWDLHPSDEFRIRDGNKGVCSHVAASARSPLIGTFIGHSVSQFDGSAGGTYPYGGGGWIESSPTNASGCLTVEFRPDGDGNKGTGFGFTVECLQDSIAPSKLFISEYYNDCDGDMYIEIFNPTNEKINLGTGDFSLRRQTGTTFGGGGNTYNLSGYIQPYSSYVVCKSGINSTVRPDCDATISSFGNGSWFSKIKCKEALGLFQKGFVIDQVGDETTFALREGASSRSLAGVSVAGIADAITSNTLIRKKEVVCGSVDWDASSGTNEANSQWLLIPDGRFKNVGMHVFGNPKVFISEFYGRNTTDAYVEIYNGSGGTYDLDQLEIILAEGSEDWAGNAPAGTPSYSGGWTQAGAHSKILPLSGELKDKEVHVISNLGGNPAIVCQSDLLLDGSSSNGQRTLKLKDGKDAIGLFLNHVLIDVVGHPGSNAAQKVGRVSGATSTRVLVRGSGVRESNCDWSDSSGGSWPDWDLFNYGDFSHVGAHKKEPTKCFEEVIFTEIVNTKKKIAIGIMNKSTTSLNLSEIKIKMATDGTGWESNAIEFPRGMSLAPNTEFVVYQTNDGGFDDVPSRQKMTTNKLFLSDGVTRHLGLDDALAIVKEDGEILDIFGDPNKQNNGVGYRIGGVNNALEYNVVRRKSSIEVGNPKPMDSFGFTRLNSEWFLVNNTNLEGFGEANNSDVVPGIEYRITNIGDAECGGSTGTIQISATGGIAPLRVYVNDQLAEDGIISNLTTGIHALNIRDVYGVNHRTTFDYAAPTGTSFSASVETLQAPSCFRDPDGIAQVVSEENQLSYQWSNGVTTATNRQLSAGFHTVTLTNSTGCEQVINFEVAAATSISATLSGVASVCNENSGSISINVSGGSGEYSYLWNTGSIGNELNNVPNGNYEVTVTDSKECTTVSSISLIGPLGVTVAENVVQPTCQSNGSIELQVSGGNAPYQYNWNNNGFIEDGAVINNLVAGQYAVIVKDNNGCEVEKQFVIQNESSATASIEATKNASCNGTSDGQAIISGAEDGMLFLWEDGSNAASNTNLAAGIHQVTVTSSQGCSAVLQVEIQEASSLEGSISYDAPINCSTGFGQITAHARGGEGTYQYNWNTGHTYHSIIIVNQGEYVVTITDENGCSDTQTLIINSNCNLQDDQSEKSARSAQLMDPFVLSQINFYPNPTNGLLTIADKNKDFEKLKIQIYSAQGQLVREVILSDRQEQINLTALTNGLYMAKITRNHSIGFQKIIVER